MRNLIAYLFCSILILVCVKNTFKKSNEEDNEGYSISRLNYYVSVLITFIIMILNLERIYINILKFWSNNFNISFVSVEIVKSVGLILVFFSIQLIINLLFKLLTKPFLDISKYLFKNKFIRAVISIVFGTLKALIILIIIFIGIASYNSSIGKNNNILLFKELKAFNLVESIVQKNKPTISYNEVKEYIPVNSNVVIYYNGVTLEEGIKTNNEIDNKAKELASNSLNDKDIARRIYTWVGSNIEYDYKKAEKALTSEGVDNSGAIEAFETGRGICFDYACLYVAMCKANGLKVRLITGEAFDGNTFGPHAWNQVYLKNEERWINVDPTYYFAGDYFDNEDFNVEHKAENIAGEW